MENNLLLWLLGSGFIGTFLGGGFVQFLITRHDNKKEKLEAKKEKEEEQKKEERKNEINSKLDKIINDQKETEMNLLRVQLLVMMNLMPTDQKEIMKLAQKYFHELKGDWFYSSLFVRWLKDNGLEKPMWFEEHKEEE